MNTALSLNGKQQYRVDRTMWADGELRVKQRGGKVADLRAHFLQFLKEQLPDIDIHYHVWQKIWNPTGIQTNTAKRGAIYGEKAVVQSAGQKLFTVETSEDQREFTDRQFTPDAMMKIRAVMKEFQSILETYVQLTV